MSFSRITCFPHDYTIKGIIIYHLLEICPYRVYYGRMDNPIGTFIKKERKRVGLTQVEFALRSGLGLRFVRDLEQGKPTVRLDKVNQALLMFGHTAAPVSIKELS